MFAVKQGAYNRMLMIIVLPSLRVLHWGEKKNQSSNWFISWEKLLIFSQISNKQNGHQSADPISYSPGLDKFEMHL